MVGRPIYHEVSELMPPGQPKARRRRRREALEEEPKVGGARMTEAEAVRENLVSRSFEKKAAAMAQAELIEYRLCSLVEFLFQEKWMPFRAGMTRPCPTP